MDRCVVLFPSCVCDNGQMHGLIPSHVCDNGQMRGLISIMCVCDNEHMHGLIPSCMCDNGQMRGLISVMCVWQWTDAWSYSIMRVWQWTDAWSYFCHMCATMDRCVVLFHYACATLDRCVVLFPSCACVTMDRCKGLFPFVAVSASLPGRQGHQSIKATERMGHKDAGDRLQAWGMEPECCKPPLNQMPCCDCRCGPVEMAVPKPPRLQPGREAMRGETTRACHAYLPITSLPMASSRVITVHWHQCLGQVAVHCLMHRVACWSIALILSWRQYGGTYNAAVVRVCVCVLGEAVGSWGGGGGGGTRRM